MTICILYNALKASLRIYKMVKISSSVMRVLSYQYRKRLAKVNSYSVYGFARDTTKRDNTMMFHSYKLRGKVRGFHSLINANA